MKPDARTEKANPRAYVPALGSDALTLYDPTLRVLLSEDVVKQRVLDQTAIRPSQDVLDLGCGTGTRAILANRSVPGAHVVGLDGDPKVLAIGKQKITRVDLDVKLVEGMAYAASLPAHSFDRVLSSLVLHHLTHEERRSALAREPDGVAPSGPYRREVE